MNSYVKAATRARLLGNIVRGRAADHPRRRAVLAVARHLHDASLAFLDEADKPAAHVPEAAGAALLAARDAARAAGTGVSPVVVDHVAEIVTGERVRHYDLHPLHFEHLDAERTIRARLLAVHESGHLDSRDEDVALAALSSLVDLHADHDELAATVRTYGRWNRDLPVTYRTADGRRTAELRSGHLTVHEGSRLLAEIDVPEEMTPAGAWDLIAAA
ncbi:hypothetical protein [Streptomyces sp. NPDC053560]|uniref:hypothetical protein n=1 Tax=Streptomyces sp. NPDC053560 TaxID=3365711 RepID=UPI0037D32347